MWLFRAGWPGQTSGPSNNRKGSNQVSGYYRKKITKQSTVGLCYRQEWRWWLIQHRGYYYHYLLYIEFYSPVMVANIKSHRIYQLTFPLKSASIVKFVCGTRCQVDGIHYFSFQMSHYFWAVPDILNSSTLAIPDALAVSLQIFIAELFGLKTHKYKWMQNKCD